MVDIEGLATGPETTILTIAAQEFDPLEHGSFGRDYYVRVDLESQESRTIEQGTIDWWSTQPEVVREEAFSEHGRIPLREALQGLHRVIWHARRVWAQGPTYDMNILEHAFKSLHMPLPWKYHMVRDSRTVFSLWPDQPIPPTTHHALEDCRRQIIMLQNTLKHLNVKALR